MRSLWIYRYSDSLCNFTSSDQGEVKKTEVGAISHSEVDDWTGDEC